MAFDGAKSTTKKGIGSTETVVFTATEAIMLTGWAICNPTGNNVTCEALYAKNGGDKIHRWGPKIIPPGEAVEIIDSSREPMENGDELSVISDDDTTGLDSLVGWLN